MSNHAHAHGYSTKHSRAHRWDIYKPWAWVVVTVLAFGAGRWSVGWGDDGISEGSSNQLQASNASSFTPANAQSERGWWQSGNPFGAGQAVDAPGRSAAATSVAEPAAQPAKDETLQQLASLLQTGQVADINHSKWAKVASESAATLEFLTRQFMQASAGPQKQALFAILNGVDTAQRDQFAMQLTHSTNPQDRVMAYQWLAASRHGDAATVQQAVLNASTQERDSQALIAVIDSLAYQSADLNAASKAASISRLAALTQHTDPAVARQAIGHLTSLSQDEQTISLLRTHLQASTPELQLAALKGLSRISPIDSETRQQIARLSTDPSVSSTVRKVSSNFLRDQTCSS